MIKKVLGLFFTLGLILSLCSCAPVTIKSSPAGANVYSTDGHTLLGKTPYQTQVWFSEKEVLVRQNRFFEKPVTLNYASPKAIALELYPKPVSVSSTPVATVYPAASQTAIGETPMKVSVRSAPSSYILKAADYYDMEISVSPESPDPLVVELARRPIVTLSASLDGVEIYENNKRIGAAPLRTEILTPRTFEFRKENYFTKEVTLNGAPPYEKEITLKPFPVITVSATPAGAKISQDGKALSTGSAKFAVGGKAIVEVRANRYYPQTVTLTPESPATVDVELKAMPYVMITEPAGAEVLIAGTSVGTVPVELLIEKETVIELRKKGFVTQTATLTGKDKKVSLTLEAIPEVTAETTPATKPPEVPAQTDAPAEVSVESAPSPLLWAVGAAAVVAALIAIILIKRKKK